ncbi:MAG: BMP family ABC transporter substrate-binding protein [Oscillospiraceae bacterium]|jgi:basic membrane protein A|nr:BMP family ABC transporter substrate-binding protein [Oscillospiraceae bacterium]
MKNILALLLAAVMATAMFSACSSAPPASSTGSTPVSDSESAASAETPTSSTSSATGDVIIALAADQGGINDKAINEGTYKGMLEASETMGFELKVIESRSHEDYEPTLDTFVSAQAKLIIGVGSQMSEAIKLVAERNPDYHFVCMDAVADAPNAKSFVFKEQEGSFLAGIVAGMMTKTNKVGFIGGKDIEVINRFEVGFAAGVMCVNPEAGKYLLGSGGASGAGVKFVDSFNDSNKAYELAKSLYADGCDIIYHAAGGAGIGMFQAAKDVIDGGTEVWTIGVDQDQAVVLPEYADFILTSMVKQTGKVAQAVIQDELNGVFEPGKFVVGLAEDAVGLSESSAVNTPSEVLDIAEKAAQMVKAGQIDVPETRAELEKFQPVEIK